MRKSEELEISKKTRPERIPKAYRTFSLSESRENLLALPSAGKEGEANLFVKRELRNQKILSTSTLSPPMNEIPVVRGAFR